MTTIAGIRRTWMSAPIRLYRQGAHDRRAAPNSGRSTSSVALDDVHEAGESADAEVDLAAADDEHLRDRHEHQRDRRPEQQIETERRSPPPD